MSNTKITAWVCSLGAAAGAVAGQIAYDGFGNGPRTSLDGSTGGTGWAGAWIDTGSSELTGVGGTGLTYANLPTIAGAATTPSGGFYDAADFYRMLPAYTFENGQMYISFLIRPNTGFGMYGGLRIGTYPRALTIGAPLGMYQYGLETSEGIADLSNIGVAAGTTAFLVLKVQHAGNNTAFELFVNPDLTQGEPINPSASLGYTNVLVSPTFIELYNDGGFTTDELRVGTTWDDVAPPTTGACCVGTALCLQLSQGDCGIIPGSVWGGIGGPCSGGCVTVSCDTIDFNHDDLFPDTLDIEDFLRVFSGGACSNAPHCGDIDFNNDGLFPDTQDIQSLLSVFSGGACL